MIADYGANAGQQWFDQTFVPAYQKDRSEAKVSMHFTAWADLGQKRDTLYAAGQGPDLVQSGAGQSYAYRKLVVPIDDRVRRWKEWGDYHLFVAQTGTDPNAAVSTAMRNVREGKQSPKEALDEAARLFRESLDGGAREVGL
jgi:ABC-type glycerol-3-phosphate transport system substrate-binding protein